MIHFNSRACNPRHTAQAHSQRKVSSYRIFKISLRRSLLFHQFLYTWTNRWSMVTLQ